MFWQILPSISLCFIFRRFWPICYIYKYIYIYIQQIYYVMNKYVWCLMRDTLLRDTSSSLIKHVHDVISLLYYKHWTDKWKYIPYMSVTQKVLKSCRSKMATLEHNVCDVHGASSLYIKTCWKILYRGRGGVPPQPKIFSFTPSPSNFYSLPPKVNSTQ